MKKKQLFSEVKFTLLTVTSWLKLLLKNIFFCRCAIEVSRKREVVDVKFAQKPNKNRPEKSIFLSQQ